MENQEYVDPNMTVYFNPSYHSYTIAPLEGEDSVKMTYEEALKQLNEVSEV